MNRIRWPLRLLVSTAILLTSCGGGGDGSEGGVGMSPPTLALFAGNLGGSGSNDGIGQTARFDYPAAVAIDGTGNVYVADVANSTIRKISPAGVVTTFAGTAKVIGSADGTGPAASFRFPQGIATDSAGNLYVADTGNNTIRKITPGGVVSTFAGTAGVFGSADGTGPAASFRSPLGIVADSAGNLYVADSGSATIRKITPAGVVSTFAGTANVSGNTDGAGSAASFSGPSGIAIDGSDNVYVSDSGNGSIRKITPAGSVSTLAGGAFSGSMDGTGPAARFQSPRGISADSAGNLYVADFGNSTIRKITPEGVVSTFAGTAGNFGSSDGTGPEASFFGPLAVATDGADHVYVADTFNYTLRKISPTGVVSTFAGMAEAFGSVDGAGPDARFSTATGIAEDGAGNVYVADYHNHTIRRVTPSGTVSTFAGTAQTLGSTDGMGPAASFNGPKGIAVDTSGNVYVADSANWTIRRITPSGVVTTFAGTVGIFGSTDGRGSAASFRSVTGIATDNAGNIYAADSNTIRRITAAGVVSTLAGLEAAPGSTDGIGPAASFRLPQGIATDAEGNVYVADTENHIVRKVTPAGNVSTLAGMAGEIGSIDGTGPAARFNAPSGIATDQTGNVYVADTGNHTIRKISPVGAVSTLVGVAGVQGFLPGPLPGVLKAPNVITVSGGSLYIGFRGGVAIVRSLN